MKCQLKPELSTTWSCMTPRLVPLAARSMNDMYKTQHTIESLRKMCSIKSKNSSIYCMVLFHVTVLKDRYALSCTLRNGWGSTAMPVPPSADISQWTSKRALAEEGDTPAEGSAVKKVKSSEAVAVVIAAQQHAMSAKSTVTVEQEPATRLDSHQHPLLFYSMSCQNLECRCLLRKADEGPQGSAEQGVKREVQPEIFEMPDGREDAWICNAV